MKNMGRKFYLLFVLLLVSASGFSQLKVDKLGHIGMGTNYPNNGYRLHVKGDVLLTNWPEQPWYEFQFKVAQKDGAVIGCTGGTIDFYTSNSGYNTLIAYKFKTHSTWDREGEGLGDALKIIMGLKPQCVTETNENQMKKTYSFSPDELIKFIPSAIDIVEDGYCTDYDQIIPILVAALQEQQRQIDELQKILSQQKGGMGDSENKGLEESLGSQEGAVLFDNVPNPFYENTEIRMYIPDSANEAKLVIYNLQGMEMKSYSITQKKEQAVVVIGSELQAGIYLYSLIVDGQIIDTKRMVLVN